MGEIRELKVICDSIEWHFGDSKCETKFIFVKSEKSRNNIDCLNHLQSLREEAEFTACRDHVEFINRLQCCYFTGNLQSFIFSDTKKEVTSTDWEGRQFTEDQGQKKSRPAAAAEIKDERIITRSIKIENSISG